MYEHLSLNAIANTCTKTARIVTTDMQLTYRSTQAINVSTVCLSDSFSLCMVFSSYFHLGYVLCALRNLTQPTVSLERL